MLLSGLCAQKPVDTETTESADTRVVLCTQVLFWWSHDIGGHRSNRDFAAYDPELYLRWLQWGTHAPILRTHPQPDPLVERRPYGYGLPIVQYWLTLIAGYYAASSV